MIKTITCNELEDLLKNQAVKLLDARDEVSYLDSHIDSAEYLPREKFEDICNLLEKDKPVLIYCYKGNRSKILAQFLSDHGFAEVYNLEGGYSAWIEHAAKSKPSN